VFDKTVRSFHPLGWGANDWEDAEGKCQEWLNPANATAKASHTCAGFKCSRYSRRGAK
jgi:hypothetical protein